MNYILDQVRDNPLTQVGRSLVETVAEPMRFATKNALSNGHAAIEHSLFSVWIDLDLYIFPLKPQPLWQGHPLIQTLYQQAPELFPRNTDFIFPPEPEQPGADPWNPIWNGHRA